MAGTMTVGICAHNEAETIGTLLDQVLAEAIPLDEVIVVAAGDDGTIRIVREKAETCEDITLITEDEREGQVAAQNKILERAESDLLLLVDGDGTIQPGSLEQLYDQYDGEGVLCGRDIAVTGDTVMGFLIALLWDLHHELFTVCPKFSTQLTLIPADLIERIPPDLVLDCEYIAVKAREEGYAIQYVPEAIKYHHTGESLPFYLNQRRKNWAGRSQIMQYGYDSTRDTGTRLRFFLSELWKRPMHEKIGMMALAGLELVGITLAVRDRITDNWPRIWYR